MTNMKGFLFALTRIVIQLLDGYVVLAFMNKGINMHQLRKIML